MIKIYPSAVGGWFGMSLLYIGIQDPSDEKIEHLYRRRLFYSCPATRYKIRVEGDGC